MVSAFQDFNSINTNFFDTIQIEVENSDEIVKIFAEEEINVNGFENGKISITIDEMTSEEDIFEILSVFATIKNTEEGFEFEVDDTYLPQDLIRTSEFLNARKLQFISYRNRINALHQTFRA